MSPHRTWLIALIVFALALLGAWIGVMESQRNDQESDEQPPEEVDGRQGADRERATGTPAHSTSTDERTVAGESYTAEVPGRLRFTLAHPASTTVSKVRETIYEITYVGPESEPNTEITDGYYISLQFASGTSTDEYIAAQDTARGRGTTTLGERTVATYTSESALSGEDVPHVVFTPEASTSTVVDIAYQTFADTDGTYRNEVMAIIRSLTFSETGPASQISVDRPEPGVSVSSPIVLSGEARGNWFFEADAPVVVTDWDGRIIGEGFISAEGEWMTESFVPFSGSVTYDWDRETAVSASGTVIFRRANPSGLPENDAAIEIPVVLE